MGYIPRPSGIENPVPPSSPSGVQPFRPSAPIGANHVVLRCAYCSAAVEGSHGSKCKNCGAAYKLGEPPKADRIEGRPVE